MARGQSVIRSIVDTVKKGATRIKSNLAVDPNMTKRRARQYRDKQSDTAKKKLSEMIGDDTKIDEKKKILDDFAKDKSAFQEVFDDEFVGNKQAELSDLKKVEYKKRKKAAAENNQTFDKGATMKDLDDSGVYNLDDPYKGLDDDFSKNKASLDTERAKTLAKEEAAFRKNPDKYTDDDIDGMIRDNKTKSDAEYKGQAGTTDGKTNRSALETETKRLEAMRGTNKQYDASATNELYDGKVKELTDGLKSKKDSIFEESGMRQGTREAALSKLTGKFDGTMNRGRDYFWDGPDNASPHKTTEIRATRIGAAALGTAGVLVGSRYLTGGNMKYNADGEKDIAGIPFI